MTKTVTTKVTRTVEVEFDEEAMAALLREACSAPPSATVKFQDWGGGATVTWSTLEEGETK